MVVYTVDELPPELAAVLPADAALRRSLFFLARTGSPALAALMEQLPEPTVDHVDEGMALARTVGNLAGRSRILVELLRPEEVPAFGAVYLGTYALGVHTGAADAARAVLAERGARLHSIRAILDHVAIVHLRDAHGVAWTGPLVERWSHDDAIGLRVIEPAAPGLYVIELPELPYAGYSLLAAGASAETATPQGGAYLARDVQAVAAVTAPPAAHADLCAAALLANEVPGPPTDTSGDYFSCRLEPPVAGTIEVGAQLDVYRDGILDKWVAASTPLLPPGWTYDATRFRAMLLGARRAVETLRDVEALMPSDLLPVHLLADETLRTADDFARAASERAASAALHAHREVPPVLARHGLAPLAPAMETAFWHLLPQAMLGRRWGIAEMVKTRAAAKRLVRGPLLDVALEEWVARFATDDDVAFREHFLFTYVMDILAERAGNARTRAATRRALART